MDQDDNAGNKMDARLKMSGMTEKVEAMAKDDNAFRFLFHVFIDQHSRGRRFDSGRLHQSSTRINNLEAPKDHAHSL